MTAGIGTAGVSSQISHT